MKLLIYEKSVMVRSNKERAAGYQAWKGAGSDQAWVGGGRLRKEVGKFLF
ncbi:MAG: hypothetical protein AB7V18_07890 [Pyrinomonadaceae bacterium]